MAKEKYEAPTLVKLAKKVAGKNETTQVGKEVNFDHDNIRQVAIKCIDEKNNVQSYFNAYRHVDADVWHTGKPSTSAVKDVEKATKGMVDLSKLEATEEVA